MFDQRNILSPDILILFINSPKSDVRMAPEQDATICWSGVIPLVTNGADVLPLIVPSQNTDTSQHEITFLDELSGYRTLQKLTLPIAA